MMKSVLVTGGAGFIGSHFISYLLNKYNDLALVNFDKLTYAANLTYLTNHESDSRYTFIEGDICNETQVNDLFNQYQFDSVFHFAAESHVDNSIHTPEIFLDTNIKGTFYLLHAAKRLWMDSPFQVKPNFKEARFHHVSTDEVYGSLGSTGLFTETTSYAPNSPYSASKASSDFMVRCYHHTYGINMTISNCSNNYGPHQHHEKLIPTIIRNAIHLKPIPIYGNGQNVRDWLFVTDHCDAIATIFAKGQAGETYNIGTRNELTNLDLCHLICSSLDSLHPRSDGLTYQDLITFVADRPGHDQRYAIDPSKLEQDLGWQASSSFKADLETTITYYLNHYVSTS